MNNSFICTGMSSLRTIGKRFVMRTGKSKLQRDTSSPPPLSYALEETTINTMVTALSRKIEEILPELIQEALSKYTTKEMGVISNYIHTILPEKKEAIPLLPALPPLPHPALKNAPPKKGKISFTQFAENQIEILKKQTRKRTASNYQTALGSLTCFLKKDTISFNQITEDQIAGYQESLMSEGLNLNTISCYMRTLRSIYNKAVKAGIATQPHPFKNAYTKIGETSKRAISVQQMQKLKSLTLRKGSTKNLARDLFLFCFFTRGMSFVDMAYLQKQQIRNGYIVYKRQKTHQKISIKLEPCMQKIIDRYITDGSEYIFPIITSTHKDKADTQYRSKECYYNRLLKELGKMIKTEIPLSFYVARHTWASLAFQNRTALETISKALGHTSQRTTLIYIKSIGEESAINKANSKLIRSVFSDN